MTINAAAPSVSTVYVGTGTETSFPFPFGIDNTGEARVYVNGVAIAPSSYDVAVAPGGVGGTVTLKSALLAGAQLQIKDEPELSQLRDYTNQMALPPADVERALDKLTRLVRANFRLDAEQDGRIDAASALAELALELASSGAPGNFATTFADRPALLAFMGAIPVGTRVFTRAEQYSFRVVASGGDFVTPSGNRIEVLPVDGGYNIKAFGAMGDGVTDDTPAFIAASKDNRVIRVPAGVYPIHELLLSTGVLFDCENGFAEISANANSTATGPVRFLYNGAGGPSSFLFRWRSTLANTWIFGGGIKGYPVLIGANLCAHGVLADSTNNQTMEVAARTFTAGGVRLSSDNNVLSVGCHVDIWFTYGAQPAVEGAHGVVLTGETNNAGCTQHDIKTHGLVHDGDMVRLIGNCDNNRLTVHGSRGLGVNAGAGNAIAFYDGATKHPRNNTIYDVAGPVYSSAGSFGNVLVRASSEGSKIWGPGQLHILRMVDYVNGKMYATPAFPLYERRELPAGAGALIGGATLATVAGGGIAAGVSCADGATSGAVWLIPGGNWQKGKIRRVRVKYSTPTAPGALVTRIRLNVAAVPVGGGFAADVTIPASLPNGTPANTLCVYEFLIPDANNLDTTEDNLVGVQVERLGADGADTYTGALLIHAVEVDYYAFGPENSYGSPVRYPDFRRSNTE